MIYILAAILIVALDQLTKFLIYDKVDITVISGVLSFHSSFNRGAAWGILEGARVFFIIITVAVVVGIIFYLKSGKVQSRLEKWALATMAGGALGNFIDRVWLGGVRDFIKVDFIDFPIFNVADCFVCIGAGLYILYAFSDTFKKKEETDVKLTETDGNE